MADLTEASAKAHLGWRRGQGGERLVVADREYRKHSLQAWDLEEVRLERCRFTDVDLRYTALSRAELLGCELERCLVLSARLRGALLADMRFLDSNLNLARFQGAVVRDSTFLNTQLYRSQWGDARASGLRFTHCELIDTTWDGAVVLNSDLRSSQLGATAGFGHLATTRAATFVDCDLRDTVWRGRDLSGATFVRCRFRATVDEPRGAVGAPRAADGLVLTDCDVTCEQLLAEVLVEDGVGLPA